MVKFAILQILCLALMKIQDSSNEYNLLLPLLIISQQYIFNCYYHYMYYYFDYCVKFQLTVCVVFIHEIFSFQVDIYIQKQKSHIVDWHLSLALIHRVLMIARFVSINNKDFVKRWESKFLRIIRVYIYTLH